MEEKNGVILELSDCQLIATNGNIQAQYKKNVYENGVIIGCLGYHRQSIKQNEISQIEKVSGQIQVAQAEQISLLSEDKMILQNTVDNHIEEKKYLEEQIEKLKEEIEQLKGKK